MIKIANESKSLLTVEQSKDVDFMVNLLKGWTGQMEKDSVAATVYSFTFMHIHKSLFHLYEPED